MQTTLKRPAMANGHWPVRPLPEYRRLCTECGRFAIPEELVDKKEWTKNCFAMFAGCPLAYRCAAFGQYAADCEQGVVMQKCFLLVNIQLELIEGIVRDLKE
jgi:hypothetical protein